jgi:hypothetical protein
MSGPLPGVIPGYTGLKLAARRFGSQRIQIGRFSDLQFRAPLIRVG